MFRVEADRIEYHKPELGSRHFLNFYEDDSLILQISFTTVQIPTFKDINNLHVMIPLMSRYNMPIYDKDSPEVAAWEIKLISDMEEYHAFERIEDDVPLG